MEKERETISIQRQDKRIIIEILEHVLSFVGFLQI